MFDRMCGAADLPCGPRTIMLVTILLLINVPVLGWSASAQESPSATPVASPIATRSCASAWHDDPATATRTLTADCTTDQPITVADGWTFDGLGQTVHVVDPVGGRFRGGVIEAYGGTVSVRNVTIDGAALTPGCSPETTIGGVFFLGAAGAISDTTITNVSRGQGYRCGYGVVVVGPAPAMVTVSGNTIDHPGDAGIIVNGAAAETRNNTITNAGGDGIAYGGPGTGGTIVDNTILNAGDAGVSLEETATAEVKRNDLIDGLFGVTVITGATVEVTDRNRITGGQAGIIVSDAGTRATIDGNEVNHPEKDGIYVQRGATATVTANVITESAGSAITFADASGIIEGNTVHAPRVNGILVRNSDRVDAIGNTVYGPGTMSVASFFGPFGILYATGAAGAIRDNTISNYRSEEPASIACAIAIGLLAGQVEVGENAFPPPGNTSNVCHGVLPEEWGVERPVATPVGTPAA